MATANALGRSSMSCEIVDVGYEANSDISGRITDLANQDPSDWDPEAVDQLFPPPVASTAGVERRLSYGSDFPYRVPSYLSAKMLDCATELSHGFGGLGNVWGAAVLPYHEHSLRDWPIDGRDLRGAYAQVAKYMPLSGKRDHLESDFPIYSESLSALERSPQTNLLISALEKRRTALCSRGVQYGRARVAVDSSSGLHGCRYCGRCLDGCVYGSIFNPRLAFERFENKNIVIHKGFYALEFQENKRDVTVVAINCKDDTIRKWTARRVYLAAGQFADAAHLCPRRARTGGCGRGGS